MSKVIVFDFDGMLSDGVHQYKQWMRSWAAQINYDLPETYLEEFRERFSQGYANGNLQELYEYFGFPDADTVPQFNPPSPINKAFMNYFSAHPPKKFSGVDELIKHLSSHFSLAILTTNNTSIVQASLGETYQYFHAIVDNTETMHNKKIKKPNPLTLERVMQKLGYDAQPPEEIIHCGDTLVELETSINYANNGYAGKLITLGFTQGFSPRHQLERGILKESRTYHFNNIFDTLPELEAYLLQRANQT